MHLLTARTRKDTPTMTPPRLPRAGVLVTPWRAPTRLPTRRALQPPPPADVQALVRSGQLVAVTGGVYRRAPHTMAPATPTVRELHDHCISRIIDALHAGDTDTARLFHRAARLVHDASAPDRQ